MTTSQQISDAVYSYIVCKQDNFNAPYGVLQGEHVNRKGFKYKSVTFGRARTLDATVEIYNRNFIVLRTSNYGNETFKNAETLFERLSTI